ncbi:uncharacterized protein PV07_11375 [Cladophialophora immunda]|uniref:Uncharacterized protein n=1 Tax=Cladophialophora immunda TaxID=569365 RepID=A0A0D2BXV5_9EURO|nr:uncharacterized protein PV07_11375 [Cladophialophora immunda]KIW23155.1 hypothetical protein PV07_11375 [Cladophialophora immunda]
MRLINTQSLELEEFIGGTVPPYMILSHTWAENNDDEVSFQDMGSPSRVFKPGYEKITHACHLASDQNVGHVWIDTCCIDKSSSAELTESINSMFQYYRRAVSCLAYLEDLGPSDDSLPECRWMTRGWTLQELIAPKHVEFYDKNWRHRGTKLDFAKAISEGANIPGPVLSGDKKLESCSVAERMSWAAERKTTRVEDMAYCLLGIFDVNMSLIYGEGPKAFRRLQEEIIKRNNDPTILAWGVSSPHYGSVSGVLADSPAVFKDSSWIVPNDADFPEFSITNKGLLMSSRSNLMFAARPKLPGAEYDEDLERHDLIVMYFLVLGKGTEEDSVSGICLRKVGSETFHREGQVVVVPTFADPSLYSHRNWPELQNFYILIDISVNLPDALAAPRREAIHVPDAADLHSPQLEWSAPERLWDMTDNVFLRTYSLSYPRFSLVLALWFQMQVQETELKFIVLCEYTGQGPSCKLLNVTDSFDASLKTLLMQARSYQDWLSWEALSAQAPVINTLTRHESFRVADGSISIAARFEKTAVKLHATQAEVYSLKFEVKHKGRNDVIAKALPRDSLPSETAKAPIRSWVRSTLSTLRRAPKS